MPNYCHNVLTISGQKEIVDLFTELNKTNERVLSFNQLVPMPENIFKGNLGQKEHELYGKNNWYDWSTANWGTKWEPIEVEGNWEITVDDDTATASLQFITAWAPPVAWFQKASEQYQDSLDFTLGYYEEGMDFSGEVTLHNGEYEEEYGRYFESKYVTHRDFIDHLSN
jgi:hypothetical protein